MNIEIRKPELERIMREEIQSGQFSTVDELLTEALHALRERSAQRIRAVFATQAEAIQYARELAAAEAELLVQPRPDGSFAVYKPGPQSASSDSGGEPFWKPFTQEVHALPDAVFDRLPEDGASEHDHYLYGSSKRNA